MFKKQLWIWPLLAAAILLLIGYGLRRAVDRAMAESIAGQLQAILDADVAALDQWMQAQESYAQIAAEDPRIAGLARVDRAGRPRGDKPGDTCYRARARRLQEALQPWFDRHGFRGYVVTDVRQKIVAALNDELIGKGPIATSEEFKSRVLAGKALVSPPIPSVALLVDADGRARVNVPTMFAAAPLRDEQGQVVGVLALRIAPEIDFTRILNVARMGTTGETYAFNRQGLLLSQSRFDDQLKVLGLIPDRDDSHSILNLELRDPQVDMSRGERPTLRRSQLPLTYLVQEATSGRPGVNAEGYRDYRGSLSYGAWTWLDKYGMGVGTEVDVADAARAGQILVWAFWGLFALLAISSAAIFAFTVVIVRLQQKARRKRWPPKSSANTRSKRKSARAAWAWSIAGGTRCSAGRPPSSSWMSKRRPTKASSASNARCR